MAHNHQAQSPSELTWDVGCCAECVPGLVYVLPMGRHRLQLSAGSHCSLEASRRGAACYERAGISRQKCQQAHYTEINVIPLMRYFWAEQVGLVTWQPANDGLCAQ